MCIVRRALKIGFLNMNTQNVASNAKAKQINCDKVTACDGTAHLKRSHFNMERAMQASSHNFNECYRDETHSHSHICKHAKTHSAHKWKPRFDRSVDRTLELFHAEFVYALP